MEDQIGRSLAEIRKHGFERRQIVVDIGDDCDPHRFPEFSSAIGLVGLSLIYRKCYPLRHRRGSVPRLNRHALACGQAAIERARTVH